MEWTRESAIGSELERPAARMPCSAPEASIGGIGFGGGIGEPRCCRDLFGFTLGGIGAPRCS